MKGEVGLMDTASPDGTRHCHFVGEARVEENRWALISVVELYLGKKEHIFWLGLAGLKLWRIVLRRVLTNEFDGLIIYHQHNNAVPFGGS